MICMPMTLNFYEKASLNNQTIKFFKNKNLDLHICYKFQLFSLLFSCLQLNCSPENRIDMQNVL